MESAPNNVYITLQKTGVLIATSDTTRCTQADLPRKISFIGRQVKILKEDFDEFYHAEYVETSGGASYFYNLGFFPNEILEAGSRGDTVITAKLDDFRVDVDIHVSLLY